MITSDPIHTVVALFVLLFFAGMIMMAFMFWWPLAAYVIRHWMG